MRSGLLCLFSAVALYGAASVQPRELRCEYRENPEGIDVAAPGLTWALAPATPSARGLHQKAYRILVASDEAALRAGRGNLWDSGRVESAQSALVPYGGKPLASGAAAFWQVRVWDQDNAASEWSAAAHWSAGLLRAEDWRGQWIGRDESGVYKEGSPYAILEGARWIWNSAGAQASAPAGARYFRFAFTVPEGRAIARAVAVIAADNNADVYLNGSPVATSSAASMPQVHYVGYLLHAGRNVLAVKATHGRANTPAGLIGAVRVEFASGEPLLAQTSKAWRASAAAAADWAKPGFADAAWQPAEDLGAFGIAPWKDNVYTAERRLPARMLRKEFAVEKRVRRATVYYSGLGLSELWLNGGKVGDHVLSPGLTDYDKHVLYETFDVTRLVARGRNAIGLWLGNGRYHAPRTSVPIGTRTFGDPKAIVQLNIEYEDGTTGSVVSDASWRLTTAGPIRANNEYDGEEYDARMEIAGWSKAGFRDSSWEAAQVVAAPAGVLTSQMAAPLRVTETLKPVSVKTLAPGVHIFDMGQNMVGWARLSVSGPKGAQVILRHAETLRPDGSLYMDNLRSARATDIYTLKGGGVEVYEPRFTYHGFRYVEVTGFPGEPTAAAIEGRVVHDDMERIADFTSSNELLNRIHRNMFWGIRGNYRSIPTDCPQRDERQGWLGDRSQVSRSESYMFDVAAFYSKWTRDLADAQRADGAIPDVAPNFWPIYSDNLTWPGTLLFIPGTIYEQYGDRRPLEGAWPSMKKWIAHIRGFVKDGLMMKDTYGDWCVPPEDPKLIHSQDPARVTDKTLIATAYYYKLLEMMSRYARLLDSPAEADQFAREAATIGAAFQKRFFKPASSIYDNGTQTANILPLSFNLVPREYRGAVVKSLIDRIENESHGHVGTGLVGAQWLMRTLSDNGYADVAYQIATQRSYPGWGYMVEQGATTVWELWNGDTADPAMNSGNHVMQIGDLAVWMYEYLAGIRSDPERPGFRHTIVRPYPAGDLTSVKASHKTPYGAIVSSWKRAGGSFDLDVTIPPNTTATVWMPAKDAAGVMESGLPAGSARGVKFVRMDAGAAVYEVESGAYSFRAPLAVSVAVAEPRPTVNVTWSDAGRVLKTTPSLQVVVNPPLRRGSKIHDRVFQALGELQADYVRYVPWLPYPRLAVAELEPPGEGKTSWDFSLIDPMTIDLLEATKGHPVVMNFSTTPQWMWTTPQPVKYPGDPDQPVWNYTQGSALRDPSGKELGEYYARLVSWYTRGGFVDEAGKRRDSGHRYRFDWWEVLNEPDLEHRIPPKQYTEIYDAIVSAIRGVAPEMKFVGVSVAYPSRSPEMFEYFLNPQNHRPGIPLDAISYHFYASPAKDESPDVQQHTFWAQAEGFLNSVRYIEAIRKRLSPGTKTMINEVGAISADDGEQSRPGHVMKPIPNWYWNLCAANFAYLYSELANMGIDVVNASQLVGYPTQYPSVSLVDWETGQPNARFRALQLLKESFTPGATMVRTGQPASTVYAQGFVGRDGTRRVLLINKRDRPIELTVPRAAGGTLRYVDQTTGREPAATARLSGDAVALRGFAVAVVELAPAR